MVRSLVLEYAEHSDRSMLAAGSYLDAAAENWADVAEQLVIVERILLEEMGVSSLGLQLIRATSFVATRQPEMPANAWLAYVAAGNPGRAIEHLAASHLALSQETRTGTLCLQTIFDRRSCGGTLH